MAQTTCLLVLFRTKAVFMRSWAICRRCVILFLFYSDKDCSMSPMIHAVLMRLCLLFGSELFTIQDFSPGPNMDHTSKRVATVDISGVPRKVAYRPFLFGSYELYWHYTGHNNHIGEVR